MIYGIIMLYILKVINAPLWCFILTWICILMSAFTLILKTYASIYKTQTEDKKIKQKLTFKQRRELRKLKKKLNQMEVDQMFETIGEIIKEKERGNR